MGTLIPIASSCFLFVLGAFILFQGASSLGDSASTSENPTSFGQKVLVVTIGFALILLAGVVNKVLE